MEKKSSCWHQCLQSAVSRPGPVLEATHPPRNSAPPDRSPWRRNLDTLGTKPHRLTNTQRRRLRRKRAQERDALRQAGALQALDNATRALVLNSCPDGPSDREPQWTNIPRSGDPSGGAAPSGGCLPDSTTGQRASSRAERFKQFSSE